MSLKIDCDCCPRELEEPGAIVISPPRNCNGETVWDKIHLCVSCFRAFEILFLTANK